MVPMISAKCRFTSARCSYTRKPNDRITHLESKGIGRRNRVRGRGRVRVRVRAKAKAKARVGLGLGLR